MDKAALFKICPKCATQWETRSTFLLDWDIVLKGYQVNTECLEAGLLLFTHMAEDCLTTMSIPVYKFDDLYSGERYAENKALSEECPRYCLDMEMLDRCTAKCECAFIREIIHAITTGRQRS